MEKTKYKIFSTLTVAMMVLQLLFTNACADSSIKLFIDNKEIDSSTEIFIDKGRTMVPVRLISEKLGADVTWDNDQRMVIIKKENKTIYLRIDSYLVAYEENGKRTYELIDVSPKIVNKTTFVPFRVISNALGVNIDWNNNEKTIKVDSSKTPETFSFFNVKISDITEGQNIVGLTSLHTKIYDEQSINGKEIKYMILDPLTAKGYTIAKGNDLSKTYEWIPSMDQKGERILVAAIYDGNGNFIGGDAVSVNVNINPSIKLTGINENDIVTQDSVLLGTQINFIPAYVKYEITNPDKGLYYISPASDYLGNFTMIPEFEDNGNMDVRVIAYDIDENPYYGEVVHVKVDVDRKLSLKGVNNNATINNAVTLSTSRNFSVSKTEYIMRDSGQNDETILFSGEYGSYTWFPNINISGSKELYVRVTDLQGNTYTSTPVYVNVESKPIFLLQGIGPKEVITDKLNLNVKTNINLDDVKYILTNKDTNETKIIESQYSTNENDHGTWKVKATASYAGQNIETEEVEFTIYKKQLYKALPIIEKDKFLDFASKLAVENKNQTGMSAALQVAQAILETGWGQSVPVDKYSGQFSYNLFGIKGQGTKGSVISNTWEEYNGVAYRIDDSFRAYNNAQESWNDHNDLLLTKSRYEPFRNVMHDSTKGAWELKRCGYATDSQYSVKLLNLIKTYNLKVLDQEGI